MSVKKTVAEVEQHKSDSLHDLDVLIQTMISSGDEKELSRADKLCYWLSDWSKFLDYEHSFTPTSLKKYKHGDIVKVHLGFNVGSEEGGLHYAVVAEKNNSLNSPVVTVIPLTSIKEKTDLTKLRPGTVYLGQVIYASLIVKANTIKQSLKKEVESLKSILEKLQTSPDPSAEDTLVEVERKLEAVERQLPGVDAIIKEIGKMKAGSLALVNQMTTISKIRIRDPKSSSGVLNGIKLPDVALNAIDTEIIKMFTNKKS